MIKKIVVAIGLIFSLSFVGCSNNNLIEKGKKAIEQGNYEEATAIFKAASEEDSKDKEEAESLYELTYDYVVATKAYEEFKLDVALDSLNKVEENKNEALIKDKVSTLKEEVIKDKEALDKFYSNMEEVNNLESTGELKKARDLLKESLENISYLGDKVKDLTESGEAKLKTLDEKINLENSKETKKQEEDNLSEKALNTVRSLGVLKKDQFLKLKSDEVYDFGDGSSGFIVNKYYQPQGKPEPAFICQYLVDKKTWKVKEVKDGIEKTLN